MASVFYKCSFCSVVKFTVSKYLTHLQLSHQHFFIAVEEAIKVLLLSETTYTGTTADHQDEIQADNVLDNDRVE